MLNGKPVEHFLVNLIFESKLKFAKLLNVLGNITLFFDFVIVYKNELEDFLIDDFEL